MRKNQIQKIKQGSIEAVSKKLGKPIPIVIAEASIVVCVDDSGTMSGTDATDLSGRACSRIRAAQDNLDALMSRHEGQAAIIAFSSTAKFLPGGDVEGQFRRGGTNMASALELAMPLNLAGKPTIIISDGLADNPGECLRLIRQFTGAEVHTIFIGREGDRGAYFLDELRAAAGKPGGSSITTLSATKLLAQSEQLLLTAK